MDIQTDQNLNIMRKRTMWMIAMLAAVFALLPSSMSGQERIEPMPNRNQLLSAHVRVLFQDKEGYMWYGMKSDGLYRDDGYRLISFRSDFLHPDLQMNNNIMCICEDNSKRLWIGTKRGLYILDKKDYSIHPTGDKTLQIWTFDAVKASEGDSVFAYANHRLLVYDHDGKCVHQEEVEKNPLVTPSRKEVKDQQGNVWQIDDDGIPSVAHIPMAVITEVDLASLPLRTVLPVDRAGVPSDQKVHSVWKCEDGTQWVGTNMGLWRMHPDSLGGKPVQVGPNFGVVNTLTPAKDGSVYLNTEWQGLINYGNETITMLDSTIRNAVDVFLDENRLWITTARGNLLLYDTDTWTKQDLSEEFRLLGDTPCGIIVLNHNVWILFNQRLLIYARDKNFIRHIYPQDLDPQPKFFRRLYTDGVSRVFVECETKTYEVSLPRDSIFIPTAKVFFSAYQTKSGMHCAGINTHELNLPADERDIHLFFTTLDHLNTQHVCFAYHLAEDSAWNYLEMGENEILLPRLSPGSHVVEVKAADSDGLWGKEVYTLNIHVTAYWYETIWAYIGYGLLALLLLAFCFWLGGKVRSR